MGDHDLDVHWTWELSFTWFRLHRENVKRVLARFDLTPMQMHALRALRPGQPRPMAEIAASLRSDPANVTSVVAGLTARGLLARVQDPHDRRVRAVALTDEGVTVRDDLLRALRTPPDAFADLDESQRQALRAWFDALRDGS